MLTRLVYKRFGNAIFSWGKITAESIYAKDSGLPSPISGDFGSNVGKLAGNMNSSLALGQDGHVYTCGNGLDNKGADCYQKLSNKFLSSGVTDIDSDVDSALYITKEGKLFQTNQEGLLEEVNIHMKPKMVAAGNGVSIAIAEDEKVGHAHVFGWGHAITAEGAIFNETNIAEFKQPHELRKLSKLINSKNSKVKKIKVVDNSAVILLENGELISWGDNTTGNLGVPRSELSLIHSNIAEPAEPLKLNHLNIKVADFDLSANVLILLSTDGQVYISGFDNILKFKPIPFFEGQKVHAVGCSFNHYFLQGQDGTWYANRAFEGQDLVKYYGAVDLVQLEPQYFHGQKISRISGKYQHVFAA